MKLKLTLHSDEFTALHEAVDKTRANSKTVKVDKEQLKKLLLDHSRLLAAAPRLGIEYEEVA